MLALLTCILVSLALASKSSPNKKLFAKDDYGLPDIRKAMKKRSVFSGYNSILASCQTLPGEKSLNWIPGDDSSGLFDEIDIIKDYIPNVQLTDGKYWHLFDVALISQYILPAWLKTKVLSDRDHELIKFFAPHLTTRLRKYFQLVFYAVYFETGSVSRTQSKRAKQLAEFVEELGFKLKDVTMLALNSAHFKKNVDTAPLYSILKVATQWGFDCTLIKKKMGNNAPKGKIPKTKITPQTVFDSLLPSPIQTGVSAEPKEQMLKRRLSRKDTKDYTTNIVLKRKLRSEPPTKRRRTEMEFSKTLHEQPMEFSGPHEGTLVSTPDAPVETVSIMAISLPNADSMEPMAPEGTLLSVPETLDEPSPVIAVALPDFAYNGLDPEDVADFVEFVDLLQKEHHQCELLREQIQMNQYGQAYSREQLRQAVVRRQFRQQVYAAPPPQLFFK